jgi:hypothetical protein
MTEIQEGGGVMSGFGTVGYDLGRVGRWARVGYGLLIAAGTAASTVVGLDEAADPGAFLLQTVAYLAAISGAYLAAYWLLGERLFARANPWLNTLILVGPALLVAYWNLTLGYALGAELPAPLVLAMLAYVAASFLVQAVIGYGGCEVVALPILVFRRRYVSYCLPIVMIDAAERGWMDSTGLRRGVWIALGVASLVTVTLGITRSGPPASSGVGFVIVAVLVGTLTYLDRREARLRAHIAGSPAQAAR